MIRVHLAVGALILMWAASTFGAFAMGYARATYDCAKAHPGWLPPFLARPDGGG